MKYRENPESIHKLYIKAMARYVAIAEQHPQLWDDTILLALFYGCVKDKIWEGDYDESEIGKA